MHSRSFKKCASAAPPTSPLGRGEREPLPNFSPVRRMFARFCVGLRRFCSTLFCSSFIHRVPSLELGTSEWGTLVAMDLTGGYVLSSLAAAALSLRSSHKAQKLALLVNASSLGMRALARVLSGGHGHLADLTLSMAGALLFLVLFREECREDECPRPMRRLLTVGIIYGTLASPVVNFRRPVSLLEGTLEASQTISSIFIAAQALTRAAILAAQGATFALATNVSSGSQLPGRSPPMYGSLNTDSVPTKCRSRGPARTAPDQRSVSPPPSPPMMPTPVTTTVLPCLPSTMGNSTSGTDVAATQAGQRPSPQPQPPNTAWACVVPDAQQTLPPYAQQAPVPPVQPVPAQLAQAMPMPLAPVAAYGYHHCGGNAAGASIDHCSCMQPCCAMGPSQPACGTGMMAFQPYLASHEQMMAQHGHPAQRQPGHVAQGQPSHNVPQANAVPGQPGTAPQLMPFVPMAHNQVMGVPHPRAMVHVPMMLQDHALPGHGHGPGPGGDQPRLAAPWSASYVRAPVPNVGGYAPGGQGPGPAEVAERGARGTPRWAQAPPAPFVVLGEQTSVAAGQAPPAELRLRRGEVFPAGAPPPPPPPSSAAAHLETQRQAEDFMLPIEDVDHKYRSAAMKALMLEQQKSSQTMASRLAPPPRSKLKQMWTVWLDNIEAVSELSSERERRQSVTKSVKLGSRYCQGCGNAKDGHRRTGVHTKCAVQKCWCGLHRVLHPFPLSAGPRCEGEWKALLERVEQDEALRVQEGAQEEAEAPPAPEEGVVKVPRDD